MYFYKIIADGAVIDANCVFLRWQEKHGVLLICEAHEAQFIQSSDQNKVWRVPWLNPPPESAGTYEAVEAVIIEEAEYEALREQLDAGQSVACEVAEIALMAEAPEEEETEPVEQVMSLAEMRRLIVAQADQLDAVTRKMEEIEAKYAE